MARPWANGVMSSSQNASPHPPVLWSTKQTNKQKDSLVYSIDERKWKNGRAGTSVTFPLCLFRRSIWPSFLRSSRSYFIVVNHTERNPPGDELIYVRTFADEDVALNVDDVVLGKTVHGDLCFGVTFVIVDEIRGYLLLRAPVDLHVQMRTMRRIYFSNNNHNKLI